MSLSQLPSINRLLSDDRLAGLPHALAKRAAREVVDEARAAVLDGAEVPLDLAERAHARAQLLQVGQLRRVINATGIVIHTNLGRAPMAAEAVDAVSAVAGGYCNLEMELESGKRGGRLAGITSHTVALTGGEDAIVVNNCAAAVMLCLTALAQGKEVLVSRGELVEMLQDLPLRVLELPARGVRLSLLLRRAVPGAIGGGAKLEGGADGAAAAGSSERAVAWRTARDERERAHEAGEH